MIKGLRACNVVHVLCLLAVCVNCSSAATARLENVPCAVADGPKRLAGLTEASGLALSRRSPGLLWSHNDSGAPLLVAFDAAGTIRGRVRVANATVDDWEDVTSAPCASGTCLYVADIGDNDLRRKTVTLYRIPEPAAGDAQSAPAEVLTAAYPDGPHDAEGVFAVGDDVYLVTKEARATLYRFPKPLRSGGAMKLEPVAQLPLRDVTDAETSADGAWVLVRTGDEVAFYRSADVARGGAPAHLVSLRPIVKERQGEGVALDASGVLYLTSEGGGESRAGSLVALRCTLQ